MEDWRERLVEVAKQWGVVMGVGVVGISLVGYGLYQAVRPSESTVEIVKDPTSSTASLGAGEIMVDVGGAVESPGVYSLPEGSRIGEVIAMAGGLSEAANKNWVSQYINLASEVEDGGKVYIPGQSENSENQSVGGADGQIAGETISIDGKININTASVSELDSLWGIGEARAEAIIAGRPYSSIEELASKANIPSNVFEAIKEKVSVY